MVQSQGGGARRSRSDASSSEDDAFQDMSSSSEGEGSDGGSQVPAAPKTPPDQDVMPCQDTTHIEALPLSARSKIESAPHSVSTDNGGTSVPPKRRSLIGAALGQLRKESVVTPMKQFEIDASAAELRVQAVTELEKSDPPLSARSHRESGPLVSAQAPGVYVPSHRRSVTAAARSQLGKESVGTPMKPFEFDASVAEFRSQAMAEPQNVAPLVSASPSLERGSPLSARGDDQWRERIAANKHRRSMAGKTSSPQVNESVGNQTKPFQFDTSVAEFRPGSNTIDKHENEQVVGDDSMAGKNLGAKYIPRHLRMSQSIPGSSSTQNNSTETLFAWADASAPEFAPAVAAGLSCGSSVVDSNWTGQVIDQGSSIWPEVAVDRGGVGDFLSEPHVGESEFCAVPSSLDSQKQWHSENTSSLPQALFRNGFIATPSSPNKRMGNTTCGENVNSHSAALPFIPSNMSYRCYREQLRSIGSTRLGFSCTATGSPAKQSTTPAAIPKKRPQDEFLEETKRYVGTVRVNSDRSNKLDVGDAYLALMDQDGVAQYVCIPGDVYASQKLEVGDVVTFSVHFPSQTQFVPLAFDVSKVMKESPGCMALWPCAPPKGLQRPQIQACIQQLLDAQRAAQAASGRADKHQKLSKWQAAANEKLMRAAEDANAAAVEVALQHEKEIMAWQEKFGKLSLEHAQKMAGAAERAKTTAAEVAIQRDQEIIASQLRLIELEAPLPPPIVTGALRRFLHASSNCEALSDGYLKVTKGEEMVVTFVDEDWFFGFALRDPVQQGWFPRSLGMHEAE